MDVPEASEERGGAEIEASVGLSPSATSEMESAEVNGLSLHAVVSLAMFFFVTEDWSLNSSYLCTKYLWVGNPWP